MKTYSLDTIKETTKLLLKNELKDQMNFDCQLSAPMFIVYKHHTITSVSFNDAEDKILVTYKDNVTETESVKEIMEFPLGIIFKIVEEY